jgi:hypothetical protein
MFFFCFEGANLDMTTCEGLSVLHCSAKEGDVVSMARLIKAAPRLLNSLTKNKVCFVCEFGLHFPTIFF